MYKDYVAKFDFDVRRGSTKKRNETSALTHRYMLCSREWPLQSVCVHTTRHKKQSS